LTFYLVIYFLLTVVHSAVHFCDDQFTPTGAKTAAVVRRGAIYIISYDHIYTIRFIIVLS